MSNGYVDIIKKEYKPRLESLRDDMQRRRDPDFFWATGTQVYCGKQGSGKTVSAVKHATIDIKEKYPKAILVSNLDLKYYERLDCPPTATELVELVRSMDTSNQYVFFQSMEQLGLVLQYINNEFRGVLYLIDEIHTYFNALDSKNIPPFIFTEISQQRKQRKLIIGTSQLFLRMAKPFREQCDSLIMCNTILGFWTRQVAFEGMTLTQDYDGSISGNAKRTGWFFHTKHIRESFDTYQKIQSGSVELEQVERPLKIQTNRKLRKIAIG